LAAAIDRAAVWNNQHLAGTPLPTKASDD